MPEDTLWIEPQPITVPDALAEAVGGHPLVAQTLYRRGVRTPEAARAFLNPDHYTPTPASALPDAKEAFALLSEAIEKGSRILVWGDFDVDGQTATTLLVDGLRQLNGRVSYHIPVRAVESHGIKRSVLESYLARGFDLLLTCDTGISEHDNVALVREQGLPVIITDHHSLTKTLPPANAVVNPQRLPSDHPLRTLPGVGVAYKIIEGLFDYLGKPFDPGPFLELAALGIVADVAELQGDTRYLLQLGLRHLAHTRRIGLAALIEKADVNPLNLNEEHIGFQLAPRMNAVGRLGDANPVVELLTTADRGRARVLATEIDAMNTKRRFLTRQVEQAAEKQLLASADDRQAPAIVLHHPAWPGGVVGIVASRLVERYQKPVLLLTGEENVHGSARSVPGINITNAIAAQSDLLSGFGGHPMAAGCSMPADNLRAFKRGFLAAVAEQAQAAEIVPELKIHGSLTLSEIDLDFVGEINRIAPFGPGNPPLHFLIRELQPVSDVAVGQNGEHKQVITEDQSGAQQRFIWWNGGDQPAPEAAFDLVCKLHISDYKGVSQVSAEWVDFRLSARGRQMAAKQDFEIMDLRQEMRPLPTLEKMLEKNPKALVWAEGKGVEKTTGKTRTALAATPTLIIWTAPPNNPTLQAILKRTRPDRVLVFGLPAAPEDMHSFMKRLGGFVKYALRYKDGLASLDALAGGCAAAPEAVRAGLQLWAAKGAFNFHIDGDDVHISNQNRQQDPEAAGILEGVLYDLLAESHFYREFFRKGNLENLLKGE